MKIVALELQAFGPFTDTVLDLSGGNEGLHIVYGPNEAGKSAALRALRALIFGIPERTTDNFTHDNNKLRIGGRIRNSNGSLYFIRRKGRANTLLNQDGSTLQESMLSKYLGGVNEAMFSQMFGLSYRDLVEGGKLIIAGGGDVGESLFAAGMGGTGLREILAGLEREADELFTSRGRKFINQRVSEYHALKQDIKDFSLPSRLWEEHNEAYQEAVALKNTVAAQYVRLRAETEHFTRMNKALPLITKWKDLTQLRQDMGEVIILPPSFADVRRNAVERMNQAITAKKKAAEQSAKLKIDLDAIVFSPDVLKYGKTIEDYYKMLGSHDKALQDLPKLKGEISQLQIDAEILLKELGPSLVIDQAESLRLTSAKRQHLRELSAKHQALTENISSLKQTAELQNTKILKARKDLQMLGAARDNSILRELIRRIQQKGDLEEKLSEMRRELLTEQEQVLADLKKLPLWTGSLEDIEAFPVPSGETLERFEKEFDSLRGLIEMNESQLQEADQRSSVLETKIASLEMEGAVPTEADLEEARRRREAGWKLVRSAWLEQVMNPEEVNNYDPENPLDKAYEKSVYTVDDVADRLRHEADRVAQKATWLADLDQLRKDMQSHQDQRVKLREDAGSLQAKWQDIWKPICGSILPPKEMRSWIFKQEDLVRKAENIRNMKSNISGLEDALTEKKKLLIQALSYFVEPIPEESVSINALTDRAQLIIQSIEKENNQRESLNKELQGLTSQLMEAQQEEKTASAAMIKWKSEWAKAIKSIGVDESTPPSIVNVLLDRNQEFFQKYDALINLRQRAGGITRDKDEYAGEVKSLAEQIAPDLANLSFDRIAMEMHARYTQAREDSAKYKQLKTQYREKEKELEEAEAIYEEMTGKLNELCRQAGCSRYEELEAIEKISVQAQALDQKIEDLKEQLLLYAAGGTLQELIAEAAKNDPDTLPSFIKDKEEKSESLEKQLSEIDQTIGSEKTELRKMDGTPKAADAAEKAQVVLTQIRNSSEQYIRLRAASSILRAEIERYRAKNQAPVLKRAGEIFSVLTLNSFSGLRINYGDDDRPVLVGVRPSGEEVLIAGMSEGTNDQLYLSLRLASLDKYIHLNEPMPFIVDDILINFDDERSEAVLKVLSELSKETQVILFTHHNHLLEIAKKAVDSESLFLNAL